MEWPQSPPKRKGFVLLILNINDATIWGARGEMSTQVAKILDSSALLDQQCGFSEDYRSSTVLLQTYSWRCELGLWVSSATLLGWKLLFQNRKRSYKGSAQHPRSSRVFLMRLVLLCLHDVCHGHYMNISWNVTVLCKRQAICSSLQSAPPNTRNPCLYFFFWPFSSEWMTINSRHIFTTNWHMALSKVISLYSNPPSSLSQCISFPVHLFCQTEISQLLDGLQNRPTFFAGISKTIILL